MGRNRGLTAALALAAAFVAVAGVGVVVAKSTPIPGTMGSRVQPTYLDVRTERTMLVTNLSGGLSLDYVGTAPDGYVLTPATFTLGVDETQEVTVSTVGEGDGLVTFAALLTPGQVGVPPGQMASGISLSIPVRHGPPPSKAPPAWLLIIPLLLVLLGVGLLRRRRAR